MERLTFEELPDAIAEIRKKVDIIIDDIKRIVKPSPEGEHVMMGTEEAAAFLGKSTSTLYKMTALKLIPCHNRGRKLYFFKDELIDWVEGKTDNNQTLADGSRFNPTEERPRKRGRPSASEIVNARINKLAN